MAWQPDYATVDQLREYRRFTDSNDDDLLAIAVSAASRAIDRHAGRQFGSTDTAQARRYPPSWDRRLGMWVVDIDDLMDEDFTVTIDGQPQTDVTTIPLNAAVEGRPWTSLRLSSGTTSVVTVTAVWGWNAVPDAVVQATLIQASRFFARRESPYGVTGSPDMGGELRLLSRLDPDVVVSLAPYVRWWGAR